MNIVRNLYHRRGEETSPQHEPRKPPQPPSQLTNPSTSTALASLTFSHFYSPQHLQFQATTKSTGTLGSANHYGYTVWSIIIFVHAAAECLPREQLDKSVACLQTYWNPERKGFCAWKMFPGNNDIYYDDNAHAAQALISVYETTQDSRFLDQARQILQDLIIPASRNGDGCNGVPWHVSDHTKRHACSTGPAAVAALRLCKISPNSMLARFAQSALNWLLTNLQDPDDGLIWDNLSHQPDGSVKVEKMKWTYNTGFAIHGFALLYEVTGDEAHIATAVRIAEAAMNREGALFDHAVADSKETMYSDGSFFLHHLADGYITLAGYAMPERLRAEIRYIAEWGCEWMLDSSDGLYYRGSRPYAISEELTKTFNAKFGTSKSLEPNREERDEHGQLCKTLIGNAGWARIFHMSESLAIRYRTSFRP